MQIIPFEKRGGNPYETPSQGEIQSDSISMSNREVNPTIRNRKAGDSKAINTWDARMQGCKEKNEFKDNFFLED